MIFFVVYLTLAVQYIRKNGQGPFWVSEVQCARVSWNETSRAKVSQTSLREQHFGCFRMSLGLHLQYLNPITTNASIAL